MAAFKVGKAVERQYLRPGNHTRNVALCAVGEGTELACKSRPSQRVYFNVGQQVNGMQLLLCHEHCLNFLDVPRTHSHVKKINRRYRGNRNWSDAYRAS